MFDAIISTKFADIFRLNSINIGLVPIETSQENIDALFAKIEVNPKTKIEISIENKTVQCEEITFSFDLDDLKQMYLYGWVTQAFHSMGILEYIAKFYNESYLGIQKC